MSSSVTGVQTCALPISAAGCGACASCLSGNVIGCANNAAACYGLSSKLQGCQAEAVRVPAADFNAALIPEGISADQALMMTDSLATAWFGARNADITSGKTVAVVGLGPIGLMAVESAFVMGAAVVVTFIGYRLTFDGPLRRSRSVDAFPRSDTLAAAATATFAKSAAGGRDAASGGYGAPAQRGP